MLRLISSLMGITLLAGCIRTVYVPVSSCPQPPQFVSPQLKLDILPKTASTEEKLDALRNDFISLKRHLGSCIILLDTYREAPK